MSSVLSHISVSRAAVRAALDEVRRRGDRRIGTEHLLVGMLELPSAAAEFGARPEQARAALDALDGEALDAIGIDAAGLPPAAVPLSRKRTPLTSGARAVLLRSTKHTKAGTAVPLALLLALLDCERPDPAAELTLRLGVDRDGLRERLRARPAG